MSRRREKQPRLAAAGPSRASPFAASGVVEDYCFGRRDLPPVEYISFSEQATMEIDQLKACQDATEKKLAKMRKEWMKVKEEIRFARRHGDHLTESVEESEKKAEEMLRELERVDQLMRDLFTGES